MSEFHRYAMALLDSHGSSRWHTGVSEQARDTLEAKQADAKASQYREEFRIALEAALKPEDALDAARYRWLKQHCGFGIRRNQVTELSIMFNQGGPNRITELDAAIDAAMKEPTP